MELGKLKHRSGGASCPIRSECRKQADRKFFEGLFEADWEVFVIKHDNQSGKYAWFTECCEKLSAAMPYGQQPRTAACC